MKSYIQNLETIPLLTKKNSRRQHFQLLEVMVAVFLILLCATPALQVYTNMYKEQAQIARINQRDHLVHLIHAKIIEQLYKRAIPLDEIIAGVEKPFEDEELQSELNRLKYGASYHLSVLRPVREKKRATADRLHSQLLIQMKDMSRPIKPDEKPNVINYSYEVYIDRGAKGGGDKKNMAKPIGVIEDDGEDEYEEEDEDDEESINDVTTPGFKGNKKHQGQQKGANFPKKQPVNVPKPVNRGKGG